MNVKEHVHTHIHVGTEFSCQTYPNINVLHSIHSTQCSKTTEHRMMAVVSLFYLRINLSRLIDIDESELKHKIHLFICIRCSEFGFHCLSPHNTSTHHNSAKSLKLCANDTRAPYSINTHSICWRTRTLFDVGKKWMKCMCDVEYTVHFYVCVCSKYSVGHRIPTQRLIL